MYGDSRPLFTDSSAIFTSNLNPERGGRGEIITKRRMNFDMSNNIQEYKQYQNNQTNSGLLRFRSAPSSMFANFDRGVEKSGDSTEDLISESFNKGLGDNRNLGNGFAINSQLPPHYPRHNSSLASQTQMGAVNNSYQAPSSMEMINQGVQTKMVSGLMRQSSSPAGLFSHLTSQNGYAPMRGGVGYYRQGNGANGDLSPTASRLKSQMSFSSGIPSSLGMLSRISEIEGENVGATGADDAKHESANGDTQFYTSEYPLSSWNDSLHFAENLTSLKREYDDDAKLFSTTQNVELANRPIILSHHLSLQKTSAEMAVMDKLLQFQDSVPCKIRAKRGCATHPRSIAERVRRTRISERMRKLQELVPHMDKQTNTADMLDLAVEYIKDLQKQFKMLRDNRANCKCSAAVQKHVQS